MCRISTQQIIFYPLSAYFQLKFIVKRHLDNSVWAAVKVYGVYKNTVSFCIQNPLFFHCADNVV